MCYGNYTRPKPKVKLLIATPPLPCFTNIYARLDLESFSVLRKAYPFAVWNIFNIVVGVRRNDSLIEQSSALIEQSSDAERFRKEYLGEWPKDHLPEGSH